MGGHVGVCSSGAAAPAAAPRCVTSRARAPAHGGRGRHRRQGAETVAEKTERGATMYVRFVCGKRVASACTFHPRAARAFQ